MAMNDDLDPKILDRVRAMLAKAESSQFAEEAAAFTAKAQELMATYAIDRALLDAKDGTGQVVSRRIIVAKPYSKNKARLLGAVARANRCRVIVGITEDAVDLLDTIDRNDSICTVFGHETDLDIVELLFTSLLLQATNVMLAHGSTHDGWSNTTRSFRHSFLIGFADVVAGRLQETQDFAVAESENSADLLPVLVSRAEKVDDAVEEAFPQLGTMRVSYSNTGGLVAGASAGHRADVGLPSVGGNRGSLTS